MKPESRTFKYSLRAILVTIAILCTVLAFLYPRTTYEVTIRLPRPAGNSFPASHAELYRQFLAHPSTIDNLARECPSAAEYLEHAADKRSYLLDLAAIADADDETLVVSASGRPSEMRKIKCLVDATTHMFLIYHSTTRGTNKNSHMLSLRSKLAQIRNDLDTKIADASGDKKKQFIEERDHILQRLAGIDKVYPRCDPAEVIERKDRVAF